MSRSAMGRDVHSLMVSIQHFLNRTAASPTLQVALKDGLGEAVVACDMQQSLYADKRISIPSPVSRRHTATTNQTEFCVNLPAYLPTYLPNP